MVMVWFGVLVPFEGATDGLFIRIEEERRWDRLTFMPGNMRDMRQSNNHRVLMNQTSSDSTDDR